MEIEVTTNATYAGQVPLRTVIMRGGSSKALFLRESDLPADQGERTKLILALFGSPDKRQIDGLGGSDYLTSKCAVMGPPTRPDADVDYTFLQVSVENPVVSYDINCGNISAGAGLYAVQEGYVKPTDPETLVRVHNTNTGKILRMFIPTANGKPITDGDFSIDGVPGSGAEIRLDFSKTSGAATDELLPTGHETDLVFVPSLGRELEVSIVDIANACVFIRGADIGMTGAELPGEITDAQYDLLEEIRVIAARAAGIKSYLLPFQVIVSEPRDYGNFLNPGRNVDAGSQDVVARLVVEKTVHKAYAGTGATCLAVAARIDGSVVNKVARKSNGKQVRIGHPSGVLPISVSLTRDGQKWTVDEVTFSRTARRLMDGTAWIQKARLRDG